MPIAQSILKLQNKNVNVRSFPEVINFQEVYENKEKI